VIYIVISPSATRCIELAQFLWLNALAVGTVQSGTECSIFCGIKLLIGVMQMTILSILNWLSLNRFAGMGSYSNPG